MSQRQRAPVTLWCSLVFCLHALAATPLSAGWETRWIDRFDGTSLDLANWTPQIQANFNNEIQCYTDDDSSATRNFDLSGGTLKIIARRQAINCPGLGGAARNWTSGRINGKDKREFLYGRIEARIRFLDLQGGTWPAFWMLENRIAEDPIAGDDDFINWPNPGAGEIDVWEWFANNPTSYITNFFNTSGCGSEVRYTYPGGASDVQQWHDYAIEWDAATIRFLIDDTQVSSFDVSGCAQYKEPMFVLLNVAIGGNLGGLVDAALDQATMEVDYVAHCTATAANTAARCNESTPLADGAPADDLVIFADIERSDWPAWDCCGGSMPAVVIDADPDYQETMQFVIDGNAVVGFTARAPDAVAGMPYDAQTLVDKGTLEFDLKMITSPGATDWKLKVESDNATTAVEVSLASSIENHAQPLAGQWLHYRFRLADLAALGLDVSTIDLVLVFPEWGTGNGAVYRLDNVSIRGNLSRFAPLIGSTPGLTATVNDFYSYTLTASDADNDPLTFSATQKPAWLDFDPGSGILSGVPLSGDLGPHDITLSVSDGFDTRTQSFTIDVAVSDTPPRFVSSMRAAARVGELFRYQLLTVDDDGDAVSATLASAPGWLTFDTGTGVLSGRPSAAYRGNNRARFGASDGRHTVQATLSITVASKQNSTPSEVSSSADTDSGSSGGGGGSSMDLVFLLLLASLGLRHVVRARRR